MSIYKMPGKKNGLRRYRVRIARTDFSVSLSFY